MTKKIVIDCGHGIHTPGKRTPDGVHEWSFNSKVGESAIKHLKRNHFDVLRTDDPTGERDVPLIERTNKANAWKADLFISCHHNANTGQWGNWTGTETYTYVGNWKEAEKLAACVHKEVLKAYGLKDRGLKKADFHVLRESHMSAILIEGGYMDSNIDIHKLKDDKVLEAAGEAIAKGVCAFYGMDYIEEPKPQPKKETKPAAKPQPKPAAKKEKESDSDVYRVIVDGKQVGAYKDPSKAIDEEMKDHPGEIKIQKKK